MEHRPFQGSGDVTEIKSGPALQKATGNSLVAVMRRDPAKAADYAHRHAVPKWYDDGHKLIDDPDVDAIYIATPPSQHEYYAMLAAAAGKPCYVEKPMARNTTEARRMTDAFAAAKLPLFIAFYRRALPRFVLAKQIIDRGDLGAITHASYTYRDIQMARRLDPPPWRFLAEHSGGGLFLDSGSHAMDLLDFYLGPLKNIAGKAENRAHQYDVEDFVQFTFTTANSVTGHVLFDFTSDQPEDRFTFRGEKGSLEFSCRTEGPLTLNLNNQPPQQLQSPTVPHVQQPLIQAVVNVLLGEAAPLAWLSTGEVALRTQQVMDQVVTNFYGGREDRFWTRKRNA